MRNLLRVTFLLSLVFSSVVYALDLEDFVIKSRLFRSMQVGHDEESDVVVSLFSVPILVPFHPNYVQLEKIDIHRLKTDLKKIYKIDNIDHIASGFLLWDGNEPRLNAIITVKDTSYPMFFSPSILEDGSFNLRVQVAPPRSGNDLSQPEWDLLDTEMVMRAETPYVLGFPAGDDKYFLSLSIAVKDEGKFREDEYSEAGPRKENPLIPTPIHKIIPAYPPHLKQDNIGGKVVLEVHLDQQGNVVQAKVLSSDHSDLSRSAASSIKQWKFEPITKKNKPISARFPVVVDFKSKGESTE